MYRVARKTVHKEPQSHSKSNSQPKPLITGAHQPKPKRARIMHPVKAGLLDIILRQLEGEHTRPAHLGTVANKSSHKSTQQSIDSLMANNSKGSLEHTDPDVERMILLGMVFHEKTQQDPRDEMAVGMMKSVKAALKCMLTQRGHHNRQLVEQKLEQVFRRPQQQDHHPQDTGDQKRGNEEFKSQEMTTNRQRSTTGASQQVIKNIQIFVLPDALKNAMNTSNDTGLKNALSKMFNKQDAANNVFERPGEKETGSQKYVNREEQHPSSASQATAKKGQTISDANNSAAAFGSSSLENLMTMPGSHVLNIKSSLHKREEPALAKSRLLQRSDAIEFDPSPVFFMSMKERRAD